MKYVCTVCGWVYDEEEAGVKWEDLPEDFVCELCGVGKDMFEAEETSKKHQKCTPIWGAFFVLTIAGRTVAAAPRRRGS